MSHKILLMCDNYEKVLGFHQELTQSNREVMISTSVISDIIQGNFQFVEQFDLLILHEADDNWQMPELIQFLLFLKIPMIVLSEHIEEEIQYGEDGLIYLKCPVSREKLLFTVNLLLRNQFKTSEKEQVYQQSQQVNTAYPSYYRSQTSNHLRQTASPYRQPMNAQPQERSYQTVYFHLDRDVLVVQETPILLSEKEMRLLTTIVESKHTPITTENLFGYLWEDEYDKKKQGYVGNLVKKVRNKVQIATGIQVPIIINKKDKGYYLNHLFVQV